MYFSEIHTLTTMDLGAFLRGNLTTIGENMTSMTSKDVMENLLPLVGGKFNPFLKAFILVYQMMVSHLGIDPTIILTLFGFVWAFHRVSKQVYSTVYGAIQENFMSTVHISSTDDIYTHLMKWLAMQPYMTSSRSLTAETVSKTAWEEEEELETLNTTAPSEGGEYLNFSNQEAKAVSRFPRLSGGTLANDLT
jgi:mitochondrial chaperone BCS1